MNAYLGDDAGDTLLGSSGHDGIIGLAGNDLLIGFDGHDWIYGFSGADIIIAGPGMDQINSGMGDDALFGGPGSDTFFFRAGDGEDVIFDFNPSEDRIVIDVTGISGTNIIPREGDPMNTDIWYAGGHITLIGLPQDQFPLSALTVLS